MLLPLPVFVLVVKVMEWSGDNLVLAFFFCTTLVEAIIIWLHPRLIRPLTQSLQPLPAKYDTMRLEIENKTGDVSKLQKNLHEMRKYNSVLQGKLENTITLWENYI